MGLIEKWDVRRAAIFSDCRRYRYTLERYWDSGSPQILWVLLNPSTADAKKDDPTNRKGMKFSRRWGYGSCIFVNLFAYRTPHPKEMKKQKDPIGPNNDHIILKQAHLADTIVVAWGNDGEHLGRDEEVLSLLADFRLMCIGKNSGGQPKHPLYPSYRTALVTYCA